MSRQATRRAIEWPRMILGLGLISLGYLYFQYISHDTVGPALWCFGIVLAGIACLGRGCNLCGKRLEYREFGFSPSRADEVVAAIASRDVDRVIDLLASPRIPDLANPRTALMISCCPRCQQIAELTVGDLGNGFQTRSEQILNTPDVARLRKAVRATKKRR